MKNVQRFIADNGVVFTNSVSVLQLNLIIDNSNYFTRPDTMSSITFLLVKVAH